MYNLVEFSPAQIDILLNFSKYELLSTDIKHFRISSTNKKNYQNSKVLLLLYVNKYWFFLPTSSSVKF